MECGPPDFDHIAAALCVVRLSGRYNMATEIGDAWTAAMCILGAAWQQHRIVEWMNALPGHAWISVAGRWQTGCSAPGELDRWERLAAALPLGAEYMNAATSTFSSQTPSTDAKAHAELAQHHGQSWAQALVMRAEDLCLERGQWARDTVRLESLRGVVRPELLRAAGAQLLSSGL